MYFDSSTSMGALREGLHNTRLHLSHTKFLCVILTKYGILVCLDVIDIHDKTSENQSISDKFQSGKTANTGIVPDPYPTASQQVPYSNGRVSDNNLLNSRGTPVPVITEPKVCPTLNTPISESPACAKYQTS